MRGTTLARRRPLLDKAARTGRSQVVAVGVVQEFLYVTTGVKLDGEPGAVLQPERIVLDDYGYWLDRGLPVHESFTPQDCSCIQVGTPEPFRAEVEFRLRYPGTPMCFYLKQESSVEFGDGRE